MVATTVTKKKKKAVVKTKAPKRVKFYGMVKIKKGQKFAWLSQENKHGFSLGFALDDHTLWLKGLRFPTEEEMKRALETAAVVVIKKKG